MLSRKWLIVDLYEREKYFYERRKWIFDRQSRDRFVINHLAKQTLKFRVIDWIHEYFTIFGRRSDAWFTDTTEIASNYLEN